MKREDLFEGAIVLARQIKSKRRTRCKIVRVMPTALTDSEMFIVRQLDIKTTYPVPIKDIRPAKITRKSLKECGFVESKCYGCKGRCFLYKGTRVHLLLRNSSCGFKTGNILQVPWHHKQVRYMHEVQKEVAKLRIKDYL